MREYDIRGLSRWRYRELRAYCRQYDEMLRTGRRTEAERIERIAAQADVVGQAAILRCVTRGIPYEQSGYIGSKTSFYRIRHRFFILLDAELKEDNTEKEDD